MTRTRIAPSPTGPLHIGTARTALFNYLFAKKHKGAFLLRIDDTDKERSKKKWEKNIKNSLKWLGLLWDEEYKQSNRGVVYQPYLKQLLSQKKAYEKNGVIYFKNDKKSKLIKFNDLVRGKLVFDLSNTPDFIIAKDLDKPLYNLASVIDDYEMKITHIIRGEDHISNTPKQIVLQKALDIPPMKYAHLPMILGPDKSKLSKRYGAMAILDYKKDYLPQALINYMAFLGWNPGTREEFFSLEELIERFSLERMQKGGAIFNIARLDWMNSRYIKKTDPRELSKLVDISENLIKLEQDRIKRLSEFKQATSFLEELPDYEPQLLLWKDMTKQQAGEYLKKAFKGEELKGAELWPPRVAVSGLKGSPPYTEIKKVLGKKETLKRLKKALIKLGIKD